MASQGTILVTGAAGCIGAWVVAGLAQRGQRPVVFDLSEDRRRLRLLVDDETARAVPWIKGDLTDTAAVDRAVAETGAANIIHLAALQVPFCKADPVTGARVNVVGHVNVFEAARKHGVKRLVYASSIAALPVEGGMQANLYGVYKKADEAIEIFRQTAQRFPDHWTGHMAAARVNSASGNYAKAAEEMKAAQTTAPDGQKPTIANYVKRLEAGQDINK